MYTCRICQITKPSLEFATSKKNVIGHDHRCKECVRKLHKEYSQRPKTIVESQCCSACHIEKPISEFSCDSGKNTGHATQCKKCSYKKTITYREKIYQKVSAESMQ